ncbi:MAG: hypothetical protein NZ740_01640 [Kiritimatiellae bacterium]|nr:hypothetical protein [Kiritimatiellia bacterium]MDW8457794.1 hypothetical protein [Verrucomicrobiota bacterium]
MNAKPYFFSTLFIRSAGRRSGPNLSGVRKEKNQFQFSRSEEGIRVAFDEMISLDDVKDVVDAPAEDFN